MNNRGLVYSYNEEKYNENRVLALLDYRLWWMELKPREKDNKYRLLTLQDSYLIWTEVKTAEKDINTE